MNMSYRANHIIRKTALYSVLCIGVVIYLYPLIWLVLNSLKSTSEIYLNPWGLPNNWKWENYVQAWTVGKTGIYMFNSFFITAVTIAFVVLLSSMAAFAIRIMKWKLSSTVLVYFLIGMMIPVHATLIPLFVNFTKVGLVNSHLGLILIYISGGLSATILILYGFLSVIQREIIEAAVIDGSSMLKVYWGIVLPMIKPALMTVATFSFLGVWNELLVALVFMSDANKMTLPVGLTNFTSTYSTDYSTLFAATFMATLPTIIIYIFFNNRIISGMAAGALKG